MHCQIDQNIDNAVNGYAVFRGVCPVIGHFSVICM